MKFDKTLLVAAFAALTLAVPACGGDAKKDDKKAEKADAKKEEKKEEKKAEEKVEEKVEEKAAGDAGGDAAAPAKTGIAECDELMDRSMKCFEKMGDAGKQAKDAFLQGAKAWQDMAANEATKQAAADACKQSLEASKAGWEAAGC